MVLTICLVVATLAVLWRVGPCLATPGGLAAGMALALVAATAGAPKTSLWNTAHVLVAIGLLLARVPPGPGPGGLDRLERRLLATWWVCLFAQPAVWTIAPLPAGPVAALVVLLGSLALYGTLALWVLLGPQAHAHHGHVRAAAHLVGSVRARLDARAVGDLAGSGSRAYDRPR